MQTLIKFYKLTKDKKFLILICYFSFLCLSILELAGIGLVASFIGFVASENLSDSFKFNKILFFIDDVTDKKSTINILGFSIIAIFTLRLVLQIFSNFFVVNISAKTEMGIRVRLTKMFLEMPYLSFSKKDSAEFYNALTNFTEQFSVIFISSLKFFNNMAFLFVISIFLAFINIEAFTGLLFVTIFLFLLHRVFFFKTVKNLGIILNQSVEKVYKNLKEGISGLKEIRILNKVNYFFENIKYSSKKIAKSQIQFNIIDGSFRYVVEFIFGVIIVLLIIFLTNFNNSAASLSIITAFGISCVRCIPLISSSVTSINHFKHGEDAINKIYDYLKNEKFSKIIDQEDNFEKLENFDYLSLENLSYSYDKKNKVLDNINLKIIKGDCVGLTGATGSGKTTLVDVMTGLLDKDEGIIKYNNKILEKYDLKKLRSKIAYLPQEIFIMNESIKKNIAFNSNESEINNEKIEKSIKLAKIDKFINSLSNNLEHVLGEQGLRISGGQKQRIALARSFYNERELMILDEFTSALDVDKEKEIMEEIKRLSNEKTFFIISHKQSTLTYCNKIYKINSGKLEKIK